jgi:hypothetical protein
VSNTSKDRTLHDAFNAGETLVGAIAEYAACPTLHLECKLRHMRFFPKACV